jgi:Family of unknown function (DUF6496)
MIWTQRAAESIARDRYAQARQKGRQRPDLHLARSVAGEHGARSAKQAIAIGLSEARRAGVDLPPPKKGKAKESTRKSAEYAYEAGQGERKTTRRPRGARAVKKALKREPRGSASHGALSEQAKRAASRRLAAERSATAKKGARTRAPPAVPLRRRKPLARGQGAVQTTRGNAKLTGRISEPSGRNLMSMPG